MNQSPKINVLSYNIHKGFSTGNFSFVLEQIKTAIQTIHADIVLLQEVVGENKKHAKRLQTWPKESQFEYLADTIWTHYSYGKNAVYRAGHHGNAILSKFPITSYDNFDISLGRFEKRGLLHAEIEIPNTNHKIQCYSTHLNLMHKQRRLQLKQLVEKINSQTSSDEPLILAGDFNDWSKKASAALISELSVKEVYQDIHGFYAKTYPTWLPILSLDRIYVRKFKIISSAVVCKTKWNPLSDHAALSAELELEAE